MSAGLNPADTSASITLSNTNHTATCNAAGSHASRGINSHSSGKWYLEYNTISFTSGGSSGIGFASSSQTLDGSPSGSSYLDAGGTLHEPNGSTVSTGSGAPDGHVISFAIDLDANKMWVRYDGGSWFGSASGDPVAGTNGLDISSRSAGAYFPYINLQNNAPPHATINGGDSTFSESVPTGYTAWDAVTIATRAFGTVIA